MTAAPLQTPALWQTSYENSDIYPNNLVFQPSYRGVLEDFKTRLDEAAAGLFVDKDSEVDVKCRDWNATDRKFVNKSLPGKTAKAPDAALKTWLGDTSSTDAQGQTRGAFATKRDPKCRFIFLHAEDSREPLKITKQMFTRLCSYHQVMPAYLDFVAVFGFQINARDQRYSGFREQILLSKPPRALIAPDFGRSGRQYQLCYNLKTVELTSKPDTPIRDRKWSIRQAAIHHQLDVDEGTQLWITAKGALDLRTQIGILTAPEGRPEDRTYDTPPDCFRSSLSVHLLFGHWATKRWRTYIQWLEDVVDKETDLAIFGHEGGREYHPNDIQHVQHRGDKTNEAVMVLEANVEVLMSLRKFYQGLLRNRDFSLKTTCKEDINSFTAQLDDMIYDQRMQIARAKLLVRIIEDRRNLVIQHLQTQGTKKMENLTISMHYVGAQSYREAIVMRIVTVVTLIYLPATFVSTFFSTDVVKYQQDGGSGDATSTEPYLGTFSNVAMERWIEVTVPLTLITFLLGFLWYRHAKKQQDLLPIYSEITQLQGSFYLNEKQTAAGQMPGTQLAAQDASMLSHVQQYFKRLRESATRQ